MKEDALHTVQKARKPRSLGQDGKVTRKLVFTHFGRIKEAANVWPFSGISLSSALFGLVSYNDPFETFLWDQKGGALAGISFVLPPG